MKLFLPVLAGLLVLGSCAHEDPAERYDASGSSAQLILTAERHAPGWQRPDCFGCHVPKNLHLENEETLTGIDLEEVRRIVGEEGEAGCHRCHGRNGL